MKKKILIFLGIALSIGAIIAIIYAAITLNKQQEIESSFLIELSFKELEEKINNKESFVLVYTQTTCAHCHEFKPILKKTLAKQNFYGYEIVLDKLEKSEKAKLNDIANVSGTPTMVFIKDGQEINSSSRLVGMRSEEEIVNKLKYLGYIEK
jgi:predicted bacteriocin transport accessory protein